jgi:hypothetical protein
MKGDAATMWDWSGPFTLDSLRELSIPLDILRIMF